MRDGEGRVVAMGCEAHKVTFIWLVAEVFWCCVGHFGNRKSLRTTITKGNLLFSRKTSTIVSGSTIKLHSLNWNGVSESLSAILLWHKLTLARKLNNFGEQYLRGK